MRNELREHRVVERADLAAAGERVIAAQATRRMPQPHAARLRQVAAGRVLGTQPRLDRVAAALVAGERVILRERQRLAHRNPQLPRDQVDADQCLGDRVLDLQPRVHLHEPEVTGVVQQEFDRARAHVPDFERDRDRNRAHAPAQRGRDGRRGRFLDELLVPPLHRAVALAEVDHLAVRVGEDLDLDVARAQQGTFDQQARIAERSLCFAGCGGERGIEGAVVEHQAHAAPAAAGAGLDHQRKAEAQGRRAQCWRVLFFAVVAGQHRHPGGGHALSGA